MKALDDFYLKQEEPVRAVFLALRELILAQDKDVTNEWKYGMPFFCYKGKMFCYLWVHRKKGQPYIGLVEGKHFTQSFLLQEKRSRMKIMLLDPHRDLPVQKISAIIKQSLDLYRTGVIKLPVAGPASRKTLR
ncbi:MAG: DUF1801 domain-containing protein [Chitinophagaceae bacterium]|nr:DUF1801 domain-containing protein [Chitinophagaceae bacterium]